MQELRANNVPDLFSPVEVGPLKLHNRVVMAPLTRSRAGPGNVPTQLNALYYAQRASAGLIIAEATQIAPEGQGYISTPGIHSREQIEGWKCVTKAVHVAGGHVVLQLWHVGRISHPSFQPGGALPVAPSAIRPKGQAFTAKWVALLIRNFGGRNATASRRAFGFLQQMGAAAMAANSSRSSPLRATGRTGTPSVYWHRRRLMDSSQRTGPALNPTISLWPRVHADCQPGATIRVDAWMRR